MLGTIDSSGETNTTMEKGTKQDGSVVANGTNGSSGETNTTTANGTKTMFPSKTCILHVSYGSEFIAHVDSITVPIKTAYAEEHGYEFVRYSEDSFAELLLNPFRMCRGVD